MTKGFTDEQKAKLAKDLDGRRVKERVGGGGKKYSYLESWDVEARANEIFGFDGWSAETLEMIETWGGKRETRSGEKSAVAFRARVRVTVFAGERIIIKEAWGYGDGTGNDVGEASELAIKEAESDAEKRAFKKFGHPFGLALYDKQKEYVRDGADDDVSEVTEGRSPLPPPLPPPVQAAKRGAERPAPSEDKPRAPRERTDPGAPKPKIFEFPRIPDGVSAARAADEWRTSSRQVSAMIRAAGSEKLARASIAANAKWFAAAKEVGGKDILAWALEQVEKRWPPEDDQAPAPSDVEANEFLEIPIPTEYTVEEWDNWLDSVKGAIDKCADVASGRDIIVANQKHFDTASLVLKMNVEDWAQSKLDARFKRASTSRR